MNKNDYIYAVLNNKIERGRVAQVEAVYGVKLNDTVAKLLSYAGTVGFFDEERRALTFDEIINAKNDLGIDVVGMGILPLIDAYDCSYIVYLTKEGKWARFSTADSLVYYRKDTLEEVI